MLVILPSEDNYTHTLLAATHTLFAACNSGTGQQPVAKLHTQLCTETVPIKLLTCQALSKQASKQEISKLCVHPRQLCHPQQWLAAKLLSSKVLQASKLGNMSKCDIFLDHKIATPHNYEVWEVNLHHYTSKYFVNNKLPVKWWLGFRSQQPLKKLENQASRPIRLHTSM